MTTAEYWEQRYAKGGNSGRGSYGANAMEKARIINAFVADHDIRTVIELGCGDGNQLSLAVYPKYLGLDPSPTAVELCRQRFATDHSKTFGLLDEHLDATADLALSLDVVFHLLEDDTYEAHLRRLFQAGRRFVCIYASDTDKQTPGQSRHMRHHKFTTWVEENVPDAKLSIFLRGPTGNISNFHFYTRGPTC